MSARRSASPARNAPQQALDVVDMPPDHVLLNETGSQPFFAQNASVLENGSPQSQVLNTGAHFRTLAPTASAPWQNGATPGTSATTLPVSGAGRRRLYQVLTKALGVRAGPDVAAARTGAVLRRGEVFEASVVAPAADGRVYLKLAGARGWVFDDSAVDSQDPSVEPISEEDAAHARRAVAPPPTAVGPALTSREPVAACHCQAAEPEWSALVHNGMAATPEAEWSLMRGARSAPWLSDQSEGEWTSPRRAQRMPPHADAEAEWSMQMQSSPVPPLAVPSSDGEWAGPMRARSVPRMAAQATDAEWLRPMSSARPAFDTRPDADRSMHFGSVQRPMGQCDSDYLMQARSLRPEMLSRATRGHDGDPQIRSARDLSAWASPRHPGMAPNHIEQHQQPPWAHSVSYPSQPWAGPPSMNNWGPAAGGSSRPATMPAQTSRSLPRSGPMAFGSPRAEPLELSDSFRDAMGGHARPGAGLRRQPVA